MLPTNTKKIKEERNPSDDIVSILQGNSQKQMLEEQSYQSPIPEPPIQHDLEQDNTLQALDVPTPPHQDIPSFDRYDFTSMQQEPQTRVMEEEIERITEAIVHEKWEGLTKNLGDLSAWKERINIEIDSIKQEVLRSQKRVEDLQKAVFGKVEDYNKTLSEVNTEIHALGKVFEKIITPLTTNVKELQKITKDLKSKK